VYGPVDGLGKGTQVQHLSLITIIGKRVLFPLFWILLLMVMGYYLGALMLPGLPAWSRLGLGTGILLGILSFGGYLLLYLEGIKDLGVIFSLLSSVIAIFLVLAIVKKKLQLNSIFDLFTLGTGLDLWTIIILVLAGVMAFLAVGAGFHETDAYVLWGAKAAGLVSDGLSGVATRGTNTTLYPLHIPMLLGMMMDTFGDSLPASKIIFPIYYLSLILVVYGFLKKTGDRIISGLGTLVLATMPLLVRHARIGYANLPLTFYLVTGVIFVIQAKSESNQKSNRWLWLGAGIMFAFASWTRPEGFWLVTSGMIIGFSYLFFSGNLKQIQQPLITTISPLLLLWVIWKLTSNQFYIDIVPVEGNLNHILHEFVIKNYHIEDLFRITRYLFKQLFNFQTWGVVGVGFLASLLLIFQKNWKPDNVIWTLWLSSACSLLLICAVYYVFSYDKLTEMDWWLNTGFSRMVMPGMTLLWLGIVLVLNSAATKREKTGL
ncbi:MAG: glycosyltransferase family 39 protein, partial [Anaerolineales bacterium]|nr:glycosyltransferase family 39 protein [Anaerolineales bacterium]